MANSRKTRDAARAAVIAYRGNGGTKGDSAETIGDLIADLAHLADLLLAEGDEVCGDEVLDRGRTHYDAERDDAPALHVV